jgi:hypothetical protein
VARYWPTVVAAASLSPHVVCDGTELPTSMPTHGGATENGPSGTEGVAAADLESSGFGSGALVEVPLWVLLGARSGDKGGDANIGVWADTDEVDRWLQGRFDVDLLRSVLPEVGPYAVERHPLANLRAVNFVVHGILGWGVASNLRVDTQAKGLGELLRSRRMLVPASLVADGPPARRWATISPPA